MILKTPRIISFCNQLLLAGGQELNAENKQTGVNTRLERLESHLDYLTNERTKINADVIRDESHTSRLNKIVQPTFLLLDTLVLNVFKELDDYEHNTLASLELTFQKTFKIIESVFINYMQMNQMVIDFHSTNSQRSLPENEKLVQDAIQFYFQKNPEIKAPLFDQLYEQYDLSNDGVSNQIISLFQDAIKIFDNFQLKITEFNQIIPIDSLNVLSEIQFELEKVEDGIEVFRKNLHFLGERPIHLVVEEFYLILTAIIEKAVNASIHQNQRYPTQAEFEKYISEEYLNLAEINDRLSLLINGILESYFDTSIPKLIEIFEHFASVIKKAQYSLEPEKIRTERGTNQNMKDLENLDKKINELIIQIENLKKEVEKQGDSE